MSQEIYLDNSMTTRPSEMAISSMMPYLTDLWGVPSAPHQMGQRLYQGLEESYRALYELIGAKDSETIVFTSSGAEAVNQVILSAYQDITIPTGKNQFVTSNVEEAPTLMSINRVEQFGCVGKMVDTNDEGKITEDIIADAITPRTALVTLSWANGLTGVINPVGEIATLCQERGIKFHLDATHVLGKLYFELEDVGADFISFNGDHIHAPKGTGALYMKDTCSPFIVGGMEQAGKRAGSFNVPGLIALGCAARQVLDARDLLCTEVARLRDKLEMGIVEGFPDAMPLFRTQQRLPNVSAVAFPGITNEALLFSLNRKGVYASIGGSCYQQIGYVLMGSGVDESLANTAISFSLSRETTEEEIDQAIDIIVSIAKQLRKMSQGIL